MSPVAQNLESAIRAASESLRRAQDPRVRKHAANGITILNWSLHLQQQIDRGEPLDPDPPIKHRRD